MATAVEAAFFLERLYPFQDAVLAVLNQLDTGLYLSGGTAASRGYLGHRFSEHLDLFANDAAEFGLWGDRVIDGLTGHGGWSCDVLLREARFVRAVLHRDDIDLKIELINDVPSRIGPVVVHPVLGRLDSAENILANKITAILDRCEPKDLVDVWGFGHRRGLSLHAAITGAQSKAAGVFPADVARALYSAMEEDWGLVRWIDPPAAEEWVADLQALADGLLVP